MKDSDDEYVPSSSYDSSGNCKLSTLIFLQKSSVRHMITCYNLKEIEYQQENGRSSQVFWSNCILGCPYFMGTS